MKDGKTYVYFIYAKHCHLIKIGYSADPYRRLAQLRDGCPDELSLLALRIGGPDEERAFHAHYKAQRERGEWFRICDCLLQQVKRAHSLGTVQFEDRAAAILADLIPRAPMFEGRMPDIEEMVALRERRKEESCLFAPAADAASWRDHDLFRRAR
jgi:hypothetical protein